MPRVGGVQSGTGIYHVMLRGINRKDQDIVLDVMLKLGAGRRQLSRVSGLSYSIVYKLKKL